VLLSTQILELSSFDTQILEISDSDAEYETTETVEIAENATRRWLVIGMNTVGRAEGKQYLLSTLDALARECPSEKSDEMYGRVLVVVVNVYGKFRNSAFYDARKKYGHGSHPKSMYFEFVDDSDRTLDKGLQIVRKQTKDIVRNMRLSADASRLGEYYMGLEDDMLICRSGLKAIRHMMKKAAAYHGDWLIVRASYGMNGIFMPYKDLLPFASYLEKHYQRRPPDHLAVEWFAGETAESKAYKAGRAHVVFKYNIFDHIGVTSSVQNFKQEGYPRCFALLLEPVNFEVDAFSIRNCPYDDIWPCQKTKKEVPEIREIKEVRVIKKETPIAKDIVITDTTRRRLLVYLVLLCAFIVKLFSHVFCTSCCCTGAASCCTVAATATQNGVRGENLL